MKAIILTVFFSILLLSANAQKFSRDKISCLNAITQKGYRYSQQRDNPSVYWYMQYDQYGENLVQLTFEGNILRKVIIGCKSLVSNLDRFRDLFKGVKRDEVLNFEWSNNGNAYGKAYNTNYYFENARYECDSKNGFFIILPIY
jgi:hypothetical protein